MSAPRSSPAQRAIRELFREPPVLTPDDLGLRFRQGGRDVFVPAASVVEVAPVLSCSALPGSPGVGISFWRGRALEVRGVGPAAESFVLIRGEGEDFFVVSESRPVSISRALAADAELLTEKV